MIDIRVLVERNCNIASVWLAAYAIAGCDTTATPFFGIAKGKILKALRNGCSLSFIGNLASDFSDEHCRPNIKVYYHLL